MSEAAPSIMVQSWLWGSQIALKNITISILLMAIISYFWTGICFVAHVCYQRKGKHLKIFFYATSWGISKKNPSILYGKPHFCTKPPPPFTALFELWDEFKLWMVPVGTLSPYYLISPITLSPILRGSTIQPLKALFLHRSH